MTEHYFSSEPSGPLKTQEIVVRLANTDHTVLTAGGIFSPEHLDAGTEALLYSSPTPPPTGTFLDIGCGWGPLALTLGIESPEADIWAIDVNTRSVDLTAMNADRLGLKNIHACKPDEVPQDLSFDLIWSNPPIRVGKAELHAILNTWIPRLKNGGEAYFVVAKHLGADSLEKWLSTTFSTSHQVSRADTRKGFRIIRLVKN